MITALKQLSIKKKLITIITFTASISLLLACLAFIGYELFTYRGTAAAQLTTMAQMIGGASEAALTFRDSQAASQTLNTLRRQPHILEACLYDSNGVPLARYSRDSAHDTIPAHAPSEGAVMGNSDLSLSYAVVFQNDRIGRVYLKSDLAEMNARLWRYGWIAGAVLFASIGFALAVSSILQRLISAPILHLAETASMVSTGANYSIRAAKSAEDEIGILVDRFNDMLEQIHARDEALQGARNDLERRVEERTRQLQCEVAERRNIEKHLIMAKEAAEASNKAKSEFLANMSHELRTPLNAIIGYSELLEEDAPDMQGSDMIADLRRINSSGKHLLNLINDVLDLSKIEAGRLEIHPEMLRIGALVDDVAATVDPMVRKGGNRLVVECPQASASMYADPLKFRQSLLNLLSNASKFTCDGTITMRVQRVHVSGREWFDWDVIDTGIGIPPEKMHKLFKSFSQVDSSATRKHDGTGLGLAISRHLCRMMGGEILVESELGGGSKFTIRMPADVPAMEAIPSDGREQERIAASLDPPAPQTILIIEDDSAVQDLLARALQKRGFVVIGAPNGVEGIRKAIEHNPSAIVLDIRMPDLDGWTVFRTLRADPRFATTPVLIHTITDTRPADIPLHDTEFLQKPVAVEQLMAVLTKHCNKSGSEPGTQLVESPSGGIKLDSPELCELGAGAPLLVRITGTSPEQISLDFKIADDAGRELFDCMANNREWQSLSILRMTNPAAPETNLCTLLAAVRNGAPASSKTSDGFGSLEN